MAVSSMQFSMDEKGPEEVERVQLHQQQDLRALLDAVTVCSGCQSSSRATSTKILPCLHGLCDECIRKNARLFNVQGDEITCPVCAIRTPYFGLIDNYFAVLQKRINDIIKCTNCKEDLVAKWFCENCNDYFCEACRSAHIRVKITRDHSIVALPSQISENRCVLLCPLHGEVPKILCQTCAASFVCPTCISAGMHTDHVIIDVAGDADNTKAIFEATKDSYSKKTATLREQFALANTLQTELLNRRTAIGENLKKTFESITVKLNERYKILQAEIDRRYYAQLVTFKTVGTKCAQMEVASEQIRNFSAAAAAVISEDTATEAMQLFHMICKQHLRVNELNSQCDTSVLERPAPTLDLYFSTQQLMELLGQFGNFDCATIDHQYPPINVSPAGQQQSPYAATQQNYQNARNYLSVQTAAYNQGASNWQYQPVVRPTGNAYNSARFPFTNVAQNGHMQNGFPNVGTQPVHSPFSLPPTPPYGPYQPYGTSPVLPAHSLTQQHVYPQVPSSQTQRSCTKANCNNCQTHVGVPEITNNFATAPGGNAAPISRKIRRPRKKNSNLAADTAAIETSVQTVIKRSRKKPQSSPASAAWPYPLPLPFAAPATPTEVGSVGIFPTANSTWGKDNFLTPSNNAAVSDELTRVLNGVLEKLEEQPQLGPKKPNEQISTALPENLQLTVEVESASENSSRCTSAASRLIIDENPQQENEGHSNIDEPTAEQTKQPENMDPSPEMSGITTTIISSSADFEAAKIDENSNSILIESPVKVEQTWDATCRICDRDEVNNDSGPIWRCTNAGCFQVFHASHHVPVLDKKRQIEENWQCTFCANLEQLPSDNSSKIDGRLSEYDRKACEKILLYLYAYPEATSLHTIDPSLSNYKRYVRDPIDFSIIRNRLNPDYGQGVYTNAQQFVQDMNLVFVNCLTYMKAMNSEAGIETVALAGEYYMELVKKYLPHLAQTVNVKIVEKKARMKTRRETSCDEISKRLTVP